MIAGTGQHVVFSAALITEGIGLISPWLLPLAGLVDAFVYEALTQCTSDPPAMPSSDDLDPRHAIGGVLNPNFSAWTTAVNNLLLNWAWDQYCTCASGSPTPVVYPGAPTNTMAPVTTTVAPCFVGDVTRTVAQEPVANFDAQPCNQTIFPGTGSIYTKVDSGHNIDFIAFSVVPVSLIATTHMTGQTVGVGYVSEPIFLDSAHNYVNWSVGGGPWTAAAATEDHTFKLTLPAGVTYGHWELSRLDGNADTAVGHVTVSWYCAAGAPGAPVNPCVADAAILQLLNTLLGLTQAIYQAIPAHLNSYAEGAVHSGLTGNGTITLSGNAIAVKVSITTDLPGGRIDLGSPNYLFDRGYIVAVTNEAPIRGTVRLVYNPQLYVLPQLTEQIGYSLPAGEVISITELTAGP